MSILIIKIIIIFSIFLISSSSLKTSSIVFSFLEEVVIRNHPHHKKDTYNFLAKYMSLSNDGGGK